jgi:hypothetical protein
MVIIVASAKLDHAVAGIYMCVQARYARRRAWMSTNNNLSWETVFTAGFELDVLRGKRPYKWTIWVSAFVVLCHCYGLNRSSYILELVTPLYLHSSCSLSMRMVANFPVG